MTTAVWVLGTLQQILKAPKDSKCPLKKSSILGSSSICATNRSNHVKSTGQFHYCRTLHSHLRIERRRVPQVFQNRCRNSVLSELILSRRLKDHTSKFYNFCPTAKLKKMSSTPSLFGVIKLCNTKILKWCFFLGRLLPPSTPSSHPHTKTQATET